MFILAACGTPGLNPAAQMPSNPALQSMSNRTAGAVQMTFNKQDTATAKAATQGKMLPEQGRKSIQNAPISYQQVSRNSGLDPQAIATIAQIGLDSMNRARTWEDGYKMGVRTLQQLSQNDSYLARLGLEMEKPSKQYESAYKAVAYTLQMIASGQNITIPGVCELVSRTMGAAKTFEDGGRMGQAALSFIRQTAGVNISAVIDAGLASADAARTWNDHFNVIQSTVQRIRYMNP
jgi:hypothetical protein